MSVKVPVDIPDSMYQRLVSLAERRGKTLEEKVRDALSKELYWDNAEKKGSRFMVARETRRGGMTARYVHRG